MEQGWKYQMCKCSKKNSVNLRNVLQNLRVLLVPSKYLWKTKTNVWEALLGSGSGYMFKVPKYSCLGYDPKITPFTSNSRRNIPLILSSDQALWCWNLPPKPRVEVPTWYSLWLCFLFGAVNTSPVCFWFKAKCWEFSVKSLARTAVAFNFQSTLPLKPAHIA